MNSNSKALQAKILKKKYDASIFPILQEKRTQSFITLALTLFALSLFGALAINPTIVTIIDLKKQLADNLTVNQKLEDKISNLSVLQQQYDIIQPDLPLVFTVLPSTHQIPFFVGQIQALTQRDNLQVTGIQTYPADIGQEIGSFQDGSFLFTIDATGTQENIYKFISDVLNFDRVVTIDTITLTGSNQIHIRGSAYYKIM